MISLKGSVKKENDVWKWRGKWAFGTDFEQNTNPFEYIFTALVDPSTVPVPSSQFEQPIEEETKEEPKDEPKGEAKEGETEKEETKETTEEPPVKRQKVETFADASFTDASSKDPACPPSGLWKGYFETPGPRQNKETFNIFINATPPPDATIQFLDNDQTVKVPEGHYHVRGAGENQYGIFELLGSLHGELLSVQRIYVRTKTPKKKKSETKTTYSTRKKQLSFKHREIPLEQPRKIAPRKRKKETTAVREFTPKKRTVGLSNKLKLPIAGDPALARWRSAHFLYYQRYGVDITPMTPKYVVYEGELLDSKRHGRGICLYSNGLLYEGEWRTDKEHGKGTLMSADRKRVLYQGEWSTGKMHGRGEYFYFDSRKKLVSQYEGEFRENLRHGDGTYKLPGGAIYTGQWRDNHMNGHGVFTWPDSSVYDGEFKNSKRHGQGLLRSSDGFVYDGSWSNNSMDGRGAATYPDGQHYVGSFVNGRREGRGTLHFTNGASYEGRFRDDGIDGQGTMKITKATTVTSTEGEDDFIIPVHFQSDMSHIHRKAGFTHGGK